MIAYQNHYKKISKIYDFNTVQSKTEHFGTKIAGERQQEKFMRGGNDDKQ